MGPRVHSVILNGPVGVGKSTVADAISDLLGDAPPAHAVIDLDQIRRLRPAPAGDPFAHELEVANLEALVAGYRAAGAERFVLAGVVESARERERYARALGGGSILLVRLTAPSAVVAERIRSRHTTDAEAREWHLARAIELQSILERGGFEDLLVDAAAAALDIARRIVKEAGWGSAAVPSADRPEVLGAL